MAAKHHITVAEIYEGNTPDLEKVRDVNIELSFPCLVCARLTLN